MEHFPFRAPAGTHGHIYQMLRDHLEYLVTGDADMPDWKRKKLRNFYRHLELNGLVVEYSPDIPSNEHAVNGGFIYRERTAADENLILRKNRHTRLSEENKQHWMMPEQWP